MTDQKPIDDDDYSVDEEFEDSADDEQTLEEEELLEHSDQNHNSKATELAELADEADMPIEQLLAKYGYANDTNISPFGPSARTFSSSDETSDDNSGNDSEPNDKRHHNLNSKTEGVNKVDPSQLESVSIKRSHSPSDPFSRPGSGLSTVNKLPKLSPTTHAMNAPQLMNLPPSTSKSPSHLDKITDHDQSRNKVQEIYTESTQNIDINNNGQFSPKRHKHNLNTDFSYTKYLLNTNTTPDGHTLLGHTSQHNQNNSNTGNNDLNSSSDEDYVPMESWKKQIQIGKEYQADLSQIQIVKEQSHKADVVWDPNPIPENKVKAFLIEVNKFLISANAYFSQREENQDILNLNNNNDIQNGDNNNIIDNHVIKKPEIHPVPENFKVFANDSKNHTKENSQKLELSRNAVIHDNEQALSLLMNAFHYNVEKALHAIRHGQALKKSTPQPWTDQDCLKFEEGLKEFGKDFFKIQSNYLSHKSVANCVNFYYFWKKSPRHDAFSAIYRCEKKRYSLHPGTTDYMDKLVEDTQRSLASATNIQTTLPL